MVSFSSHANPSENKHYKDYFEHNGAIEHIKTESPETHNYYFDSGAYISSENAFFGWNGVTVETGRTVYIQFGKAPESENLDYGNLFTGALSERLDNKKLVFELNEGSLNLRIF